MTLQEEVELLRQKRDLLIELKALEVTYAKLPSRLNDVDPIILNGMLHSCCHSFS